MLDLRRSLMDYDREMLQAIAESRGIEAGQSKAQLLEAIAAEATRPLGVAVLWSELGDREKDALRALVANGGSMRAALFEHEYGTVRHFGPGRLMRERLWEAPISVTERLSFLGLIFRGFEQDGTAAVWYIPPDVRRLLPLDSHVPKSHRIEPIRDAASVLRPANDYLLRAVYHVLVAIRRREAPLQDAILERLAADPDAPDSERVACFAQLAWTLARNMGFLEQETPPVLRASRVLNWLQANRVEALAQLRRTWLDSSTWHELLAAPGLILEGGRLPDAAPARRQVVSLLEQLQPWAWYSIRSLQQWLRSHEPDFLRHDADFDALYLRNEVTGAPLDGLSSWMQVEGRFVEEVLVTLNAFKTLSLGTCAGQPCIRVEPDTAQSPTTARRSRDSATHLLTVQDDLTLHIAGDAPLFLRYQVERIAEATQRTGQYRITRQSLRRAKSEGIDQQRIISFLRKRAAGFGEQTESQIQALDAPPYVHVSAAMVLEPEDELALEIILNDPFLARHILYRLPDTRLLVSTHVWRRFKERVEALGIRVGRRSL